MALVPLISALITTATISPDRPGFADSASTVPKGSAQLELGVRGELGDDATAIQGPSILFRVGLTNAVEARVSAPDVVIRLPKEGGDTTAGVKDIVLGLKIAGRMGDGLAVSLVPFLSIPTGTSEESTGLVDGGAGINFELAATDALQIGWNAIAAFSGNGDGSRRVFSAAGGVSLGYQFSDPFGAFIEGYVNWTDDEDVLPSVAGGVTYLWTDTIQLDLSGGAGLTSAAEAPYVIVGAAFLL